MYKRGLTSECISQSVNYARDFDLLARYHREPGSAAFTSLAAFKVIALGSFVMLLIIDRLQL
jgi:hypothetical protein